MPKSSKVKLGNRHQVVELASDKLAQPPAAPETTVIALEKIRLDGGTQNRAALSEPVVADYVEIMQDADGWGPFPPAAVTYDGKHYWLTDGFHRIEAASRLPHDTVMVTVLVTPGTRQDAVLRSLSANADHGLRRSNADKRRAVVRMLTDAEFGWQLYTNQVIAQHCAVSPRYVGKVRSDLEFDGVIQPAQVRVGQDGRSMNVAAIGRTPEPAIAATAAAVALRADAEVAAPGMALVEGVRQAQPTVTQATLLPKFEYVSLLIGREVIERLALAEREGALRPYLTPAQIEVLQHAMRKALNP